MKLKSVYRTLLTEAWFNDGAVISVLRKLGVTYDQFQYLIKNGYSKGQINQLIKYLRDGGYTFQYIIDSLIEKPESAGKYKPNRTFNPNKFPDESGNISSGEKSENDILEEAGTIFTGIDKNVLETFFRNAGGYNEHSINIIKAAYIFAGRSYDFILSGKQAVKFLEVIKLIVQVISYVNKNLTPFNATKIINLVTNYAKFSVESKEGEKIVDILDSFMTKPENEAIYKTLSTSRDQKKQADIIKIMDKFAKSKSASSGSEISTEEPANVGKMKKEQEIAKTLSYGFPGLAKDSIIDVYSVFKNLPENKAKDAFRATLHTYLRDRFTLRKAIYYPDTHVNADGERNYIVHTFTFDEIVDVKSIAAITAAILKMFPSLNDENIESLYIAAGSSDTTALKHITDAAEVVAGEYKDFNKDINSTLSSEIYYATSELASMVERISKFGKPLSLKSALEAKYDKKFLSDFSEIVKIDDHEKEILSKVFEANKTQIEQFLTEGFILMRGEGDASAITFTRDIRQDRKPKDSKMLIDASFEYFRAERYPEIPSRRRSIFGYKYKSIMADTGYGSYQYIIFPGIDVEYFSSSYEEDFYKSQPYNAIMYAAEQWLKEKEESGDNAYATASFSNVAIAEEFAHYFASKLDDVATDEVDRARNEVTKYIKTSYNDLTDIKPGYEIIMQAKSYTAIRKDYFQAYVITEYLK